MISVSVMQIYILKKNLFQYMRYLEEHDLRSILFLTWPTPSGETLVCRPPSGQAAERGALGFKMNPVGGTLTHTISDSLPNTPGQLQQNTLHWSCLLGGPSDYRSCCRHEMKWIKFGYKSKQSQEQEPLKWMPTGVSDVTYVRLVVLPWGSEAFPLHWSLPCSVSMLYGENVKEKEIYFINF